MGELVTRLAGKKTGDLIRSANWNDLVAGVEQVETDLTNHINTEITNLDTRLTQKINEVDNRLSAGISNLDSSLNQKIDAVDSRLSSDVNAANAAIASLQGLVTNLTAELTSLRQRVEPLLTEYYRVTLETNKERYAIGELAQITAHVTDLLGNPLDLSNVAARPWIDFMTAWGQLKAVPGFVSRGGAGDKTISVQTNAAGMAQVYIRSEYAEGFTDEEETAVATAMTTTMRALNMTVGEKIVQANTPTEAKNDGAFRVLSAEYDRSDTDTMRRYMDAHYARNPIFKAVKVNPTIFANWRDHRSTVIAFAKRDSDPRTPDQSRGASSIQVTFRDWIWPWINLEYLPEVDNNTVDDLAIRLHGAIRDNFTIAIQGVSDEILGRVAGKGDIGKLREYKYLRLALDRLPGADAQPAFARHVVQTAQEAIDVEIVQKSGPINYLGVTAATEEIAFKAHTRAAARADEEVATVKSNLDTVGAGVDAKVAAAVEALREEGAALDVVDKQIAAVRGQVSQLVDLAGDGSIQTIRDRLALAQQTTARFDNFLAGQITPR